MRKGVRRIGVGIGSVDGDQLWSNTAVILDRIGYKKEMRKWRSDSGYASTEPVSWGSVIKEAAHTQVGRREMDAFEIKQTRPCWMHVGGAGIYYMDHNGGLAQEARR